MEPDSTCLYNTLSRTDEGQDAEAQVVCDRGDNGTHPQNGERGITAGDDQVTRQIPEHVPAQQVTLKTATHVTLTSNCLYSSVTVLMLMHHCCNI